MRVVVSCVEPVLGGSVKISLGAYSVEFAELSKADSFLVSLGGDGMAVEIIPSGEKSLVVEPVSEVDISPIVDLPVEVSPVVEMGSDVLPDVLFKKLVALRRVIAQEIKLPPYCIFHDSSLKDMIARLPVDVAEFKDVSGVGEAKLEKYGARFISVIKEHISQVSEPL